jgi:hypothetical protein
MAQTADRSATPTQESRASHRGGSQSTEQETGREDRREARGRNIKLHQLIEIRHLELRRLHAGARGPDSSTIHGQTGEIRREAEELHRQANDLVEWKPDDDTDDEVCYQHLEKIDELVPLLADGDTVCVLLERELERKSTEGLAPILIGELFDTYGLQQALEAYRQARGADGARPSRIDGADDGLRQVREKLARLARERHDIRRHARSVEHATKRLGRRWVLPELAVLTLAFAGTAILADSKHDAGLGWIVPLALSAGALGATLSGALKLRETLGWDQVERFEQALLLQPLIGAGAGLVVFLGYAQIHDVVNESNWIAGGLVAFLGGFSEPFFLRTVGRLAGPAPEGERPQS